MKKQKNIACIRISVTHNKINEFRYMYYLVESVLSPDAVCSIIANYSKYKRVEVITKRHKHYRRLKQSVYTLDTLIEYLNDYKYTIMVLEDGYKTIRTSEYLGKIRLNGLRMLEFCSKYTYTFMHLVSTTDCVVPCEEDILKLFKHRFISENDKPLPRMIKCGPNAPYPDSYGFNARLEIKERYISSEVYEYTIYKNKITIIKCQKEVEIELL